MPARRHAAALRYDAESDDAGLAEALARLQLEAEVPEQLWAAVAEALVWAYRLTSRAA
jgi:type III secretion system FlhB-like substrate exporter